ncbi:MAG: hypothetical protein F4X29_01990 [Rhodothermaceae bacterium]|nr:hypothetical protein [Rhodothermaceae bacterium]
MAFHLATPDSSNKSQEFLFKGPDKDFLPEDHRGFTTKSRGWSLVRRTLVAEVAVNGGYERIFWF